MGKDRRGMGKDDERVVKGEERELGSKEEDIYGNIYYNARYKDPMVKKQLRISHYMLHNM